MRFCWQHAVQLPTFAVVEWTAISVCPARMLPTKLFAISFFVFRCGLSELFSYGYPSFTEIKFLIKSFLCYMLNDIFVQIPEIKMFKFISVFNITNNKERYFLIGFTRVKKFKPCFLVFSTWSHTKYEYMPIWFTLTWFQSLKS